MWHILCLRQLYHAKREEMQFNMGACNTRPTPTLSRVSRPGGVKGILLIQGISYPSASFSFQPRSMVHRQQKCGTLQKPKPQHAQSRNSLYLLLGSFGTFMLQMWPMDRWNNVGSYVYIYIYVYIYQGWIAGFLPLELDKPTCIKFISL